MGKKEKKSTIKFQKNKLKDVVKRRKEVNKFKKQIQNRQIRRAGSRGSKGKEEKQEKVEEKPEENKKEEPQVNVEDYFCNFIIDTEEQLDLSDDEEDDLNELDAFEEDVNMDDAQEEEGVLSDEEDNMDEDEEEDEEDEEEDEEDEDELGENEDSEPVTMDMLKGWCVAATTKQSASAWKKLLMTFRAVVRSGDTTKFSYHVGNSKVYTRTVRYTLKAAYPFLSKHIYFLKKEKYPGKTKNWPKLQKTIRLFLNNCIRFLRELSEDDIIQYVLEQLEPCALYFGPFPKISSEYLRVLLDRWSDVSLTEETRQCCYRAIRNLGVSALDANRKNYISNVLKGVYLVFANRATKLNETSFPVIQQMMEEAGDIYSVDPQLGLEHAHAYISQLADHLKNARKNQTVESFKKIYTWQYIGCLDFWASVISTTCNPSNGENNPMLAVLHPLVDLCLHTMRLNPVSQFLPLRIHLIRTLTGLIDATGYYVPLAGFLFESLTNDALKGKTENVELPEFEWDLQLKTPKAYISSKIYKDSVYDMVYDSLVDFYACLGLSIAFPELAIPAIDKLKELLHKSKGTRFQKSIRTLIEKLKLHKNYIEQKRAPIEYTPTKLEEASAFLRTADFEATPFGKFLKQKSNQR